MIEKGGYQPTGEGPKTPPPGISTGIYNPNTTVELRKWCLEQAIAAATMHRTHMPKDIPRLAKEYEEYILGGKTK